MNNGSQDHNVNSDHVSSDDVIDTKDNQYSPVEGTNTEQVATPITVSQSSCVVTQSGDLSKTSSDVEQDSDTPTIVSDQQLVSDRMQYLTESCSYDNSNDGLMIATPDSQSVMEDEQAGLIATTNNNTAKGFTEDPLVIASGEDQLSTVKGSSLKDDAIPVSSSVLPQSRVELHHRLQNMAAHKFPGLSTKLDPLVKFLNDCHLDDADHNLVTSIICDAIDYDHLITNPKL